jgi:hypothetical protein
VEILALEGGEGSSGDGDGGGGGDGGGVVAFRRTRSTTASRTKKGEVCGGGELFEVLW